MLHIPALLRGLVAGVGLLVAASSPSAAPIDELVQAAARDDFRQVQRLLREGVDPNLLDASGRLPLVTALQEASQRSAAALLESGRLDIGQRNHAGETALMMAALKGDLAWCEKLIARGAPIDHEGWTPLHYAASQDNPRVVAFLLSKGARADAESPNRTTPLMMAAGYGAQDAVQLLLNAGADPMRRNDRGLDAAAFAARAGRDKLAAAFEDLKRRRAARMETQTPAR